MLEYHVQINAAECKLSVVEGYDKQPFYSVLYGQAFSFSQAINLISEAITQRLRDAGSL